MNEINISLGSFMWPVQYFENRIDVTGMFCEPLPGILNSLICDGGAKLSETSKARLEVLSFIPLLLENIKNSFWSYEQEYRYSIAASKLPDGYAPAKPKEICIGINCNKQHEERLIAIGAELGIPVRKMKFEPLSPSYSLAIGAPL